MFSTVSLSPRVCCFGLTFFLTAMAAAAQANAPAIQTPSAPRQNSKPKAAAPALVEAGNGVYQQNCAFCHGRDAGGGETGPDLTRSRTVIEDKAGEKIGAVVLNGRVDNGMPKFNLSSTQISALTAYLHKQKDQAEAHPGGRRGVNVEDLQTGNADEGKRYFNGAGACSSCHSPTGDLAHVAMKHRGLKLEQRLLFPRNAAATLTVTSAAGETIKGILKYQDEFTVALEDESGQYRSFLTSKVKFKVDDPAKAHSDLLAKYTDDDIHNLMAYLQTLR